MNWQFLLIMASNFPLQRSSPPIYNNEFIHSVKWRIHWPYRKPYICLLFNFLKQYSAHRTCLTSVSICTKEFLTWGNSESRKKKKFMIVEFHFRLTSLKELNFPWQIVKFPDLLNKMPLTGNWELIFLTWQPCHTLISKTQMFFSNNRIEIEGQQ